MMKSFTFALACGSLPLALAATADLRVFPVIDAPKDTHRKSSTGADEAESIDNQSKQARSGDQPSS